MTTPKPSLGVFLLFALLAVASHSVVANDLVFPGETWATATPEAMSIDSAKLAAAMALLPDSSRSMVVRDGRVIWQGSKADESHEVASITKAFASTALGLLVDDGELTLDTPTIEIVPTLGEPYSDVTFRHLTTQTSNINGSFARPLAPLFTPSGSQFYYNTTGSNDTLAYGIQVAAGESMEEFLTSRIAEPIGMDVNKFDFDTLSFGSAEERTTSNVGSTGLSISPSNLARYGLLFQSGGEWNGERILSEEWIHTSTTPQIRGVPVNPNSADYTQAYGLGGWFSDGPRAFSAYGWGNNRLFVDQLSGLVVVSLGVDGSNPPDPGSTQSGSRMMTALFDAELPFVWDETADGNWHDVLAAGNSRWLVNGEAQSLLPRSKSIVRHNHVTLDQDIRGREISLESGALLDVSAGTSLLLADMVIDSAELNTSGTAEIDSIDISSGMLRVGALGELVVGNLTLNQSKVVIHGSLATDAMSIRESHIRIFNGSDPIQIASSLRFRDSELTLVVDGPEWGRTIVLDNPRTRWSNTSTDLVLEIDPKLDANTLVGASLDIIDSVRSPTEFSTISIPNRITADTSEFYTTGTIQITSVLAKPNMAGDFNGDSMLDASDIDMLAARVRVESPDLFFDVDVDGKISLGDFRVWISDLKNTLLGDADLDGQVAFEDFLVLQANFGHAGGYAQGDFDLDGRIAFADFLMLSANYGQTSSVVTPVPEPQYAWWLVLLVGVFRQRRRVQRCV